MSEIDGSVQQHLERPEPEQLVQDVADQVLALEQAQRRAIALALEHAADQCADFRLGVFALHARQPIQVQPVQQLLVDRPLQLLIAGVSCIDRCSRKIHRLNSS